MASGRLPKAIVRSSKVHVAKQAVPVYPILGLTGRSSLGETFNARQVQKSSMLCRPDRMIRFKRPDEWLSRSVDLRIALYSIHWMAHCPESRDSPDGSCRSHLDVGWGNGVRTAERRSAKTAKGQKQKARAKGKYLKAKVCSRLRVVILVAMMGRIQ